MPRKRYFGWAGPEPSDPRDIPYSVSKSVLRDLPTSVDLRSRFKTQPFNQGAIGSCGPQTAAADLLFDQEQNENPDTMPSRLFIYYATRTIMGTVNQDSGVYNRDMCKALNKYGWANESLWPYQVSQFRTKPPQSVYLDAARRKVTRYERVQQTLDQMKGALAQGDPFIFGFAVFNNIDDAQRTGNIPMPSGGQVGGHDVLLVGYDDARQVFLLRNSWGTNWGDGGYGTIPYAYAVSRLAGDFWTLHWDDGGSPPPPPTPPGPSLFCRIWATAGPYVQEWVSSLEDAESKTSFQILVDAANKACPKPVEQLAPLRYPLCRSCGEACDE